MSWVLSLPEAERVGPRRVGGKTWALARLSAGSFPIPRAFCLTVGAYERFVSETGLGPRIAMELGRKDLAEMRWEELWDAALRIRNLFLTTPWPSAMERRLRQEADRVFGDTALVVRSSAPAEDSAAASFAGLHDSFVNVRGSMALLDAVRKVWASLWSDRALLYRQELKLEVRGSAMAVLIQELVVGEKSGVAFSQNPFDPEQLLVEAVWGLNQGLVDGQIEPDHWIVQRSDLDSLQHRSAQREKVLRPLAGRVEALPATAREREIPPLTARQVRQVAEMALRLEQFFGAPQDVEWTGQGDRLWLLQSRPVTARQEAQKDDQRGWYLSLHRTVDNLQRLRRRLEQDILPGMEVIAGELSEIPFKEFSDARLADEISRRRRILNEWQQVYRNECIPMAHGVRLFGEFYNDSLLPSDPFEFVQMLQGAGIRAGQRNREFLDLAAEVRSNIHYLGALQAGKDLPEGVMAQLIPLAEQVGVDIPTVSRLVLRMALGGTEMPLSPRSLGDSQRLEDAYLERFCPEDRSWAAELLELGRASYRLRDDDNLSLDKIRRQVTAAETEGQRRLARNPATPLQELFGAPAEASAVSAPASCRPIPSSERVRIRQLQGQPAGPGVVTAAARVIKTSEDLFLFQPGEILVCDAIDPAMTFIVPLAAGIVERRGGMLIHGAIIAREYGLPCVTGIASATDIIETGERITVDGYLGLIVIQRDLRNDKVISQ